MAARGIPALMEPHARRGTSGCPQRFKGAAAARRARIPARIGPGPDPGPGPEHREPRAGGLPLAEGEMEGAAPANEEASESKDSGEALANQQQDEEPAAANGSALLQGSPNEGRRSCGSANEDTEPQEATNDSEEPQPASENTGHKALTNEDSGHKSSANEDTAQPSTNQDRAPQAPTNQDTAPTATANENSSRQAPPNQDTPPQDPTYDLAALPDAANQAADPWDWSLEEAWLRAPEEEGPDVNWAEPEGWGVEPEEEEEEEAEEGPERWRPSPDGAWAKLIVRPGRGLARPGPGSWCRVRLTVPSSGHSLATSSGSGHGLSDPSSGHSMATVSSSSHGLSDPSSGHSPSSVSGSSHGLSDPSSGHSPSSVSGSSHGLSDPSSGHSPSSVSGSGHGLSDPSSGRSPSPLSGCGRWLTVQLGTAEGRWSSLVDAALETMTSGELSRLRPAGADTTLTVRLGRFTPAPPFWDSAPASRWRSVTSGHARAAALLSRGQLAAAGRAYSRSLRAAVAAAGPPPLPPDVAAVKAELHAGLALVQLRLGLPAAAAGNAGKALALCPAHLEARYRRGVAQAAMRDLEAAMADLAAVLRAQPGHAGARRELRRVRGAARERDARLARRLGRLFA